MSARLSRNAALKAAGAKVENYNKYHNALSLSYDEDNGTYHGFGYGELSSINDFNNPAGDITFSVTNNGSDVSTYPKVINSEYIICPNKNRDWTEGSGNNAVTHNNPYAAYTFWIRVTNIRVKTDSKGTARVFIDCYLIVGLHMWNFNSHTDFDGTIRGWQVFVKLGGKDGVKKYSETVSPNLKNSSAVVTGSGESGDPKVYTYGFKFDEFTNVQIDADGSLELYARTSTSQARGDTSIQQWFRIPNNNVKIGTTDMDGNNNMFECGAPCISKRTAEAWCGGSDNDIKNAKPGPYENYPYVAVMAMYEIIFTNMRSLKEVKVKSSDVVMRIHGSKVKNSNGGIASTLNYSQYYQFEQNPCIINKQDLEDVELKINFDASNLPYSAVGNNDLSKFEALHYGETSEYINDKLGNTASYKVKLAGDGITDTSMSIYKVSFYFNNNLIEERIPDIEQCINCLEDFTTFKFKNIDNLLLRKLLDHEEENYKSSDLVSFKIKFEYIINPEFKNQICNYFGLNPVTNNLSIQAYNSMKFDGHPSRVFEKTFKMTVRENPSELSSIVANSLVISSFSLSDGIYKSRQYQFQLCKGRDYYRLSTGNNSSINLTSENVIREKGYHDIIKIVPIVCKTINGTYVDLPQELYRYGSINNIKTNANTCFIPIQSQSSQVIDISGDYSSAIVFYTNISENPINIISMLYLKFELYEKSQRSTNWLRIGTTNPIIDTSQLSKPSGFYRPYDNGYFWFKDKYLYLFGQLPCDPDYLGFEIYKTITNEGIYQYDDLKININGTDYFASVNNDVCDFYWDKSDYNIDGNSGFFMIRVNCSKDIIKSYDENNGFKNKFKYSVKKKYGVLNNSTVWSPYSDVLEIPVLSDTYDLSDGDGKNNYYNPFNKSVNEINVSIEDVHNQFKYKNDGDYLSPTSSGDHIRKMSGFNDLLFKAFNMYGMYYDENPTSWVDFQDIGQFFAKHFDPTLHYSYGISNANHTSIYFNEDTIIDDNIIIGKDQYNEILNILVKLCDNIINYEMINNVRKTALIDTSVSMTVAERIKNGTYENGDGTFIKKNSTSRPSEFSPSGTSPSHTALTDSNMIDVINYQLQLLNVQDKKNNQYIETTNLSSYSFLNEKDNVDQI